MIVKLMKVKRPCPQAQAKLLTLHSGIYFNLPILRYKGRRWYSKTKLLFVRLLKPITDSLLSLSKTKIMLILPYYTENMSYIDLFDENRHEGRGV